MEKNIGTADKIIRIVAAVIIAILYFTHIINGTLAIILLAMGAAFIITSSISFCPLYWPFKFSTRKKENDK